jgi:hypothetical protein
MVFAGTSRDLQGGRIICQDFWFFELSPILKSVSGNWNFDELTVGFRVGMVLDTNLKIAGAISNSLELTVGFRVRKVLDTNLKIAGAISNSLELT